MPLVEPGAMRRGSPLMLLQVPLERVPPDSSRRDHTQIGDAVSRKKLRAAHGLRLTGLSDPVEAPTGLPIVVWLAALADSRPVRPGVSRREVETDGGTR